MSPILASSSPSAGFLQAAARYIGSLLLIGIGVVHLYEYIHDHYSVIPVIGTLFAVNFGVAVALAVAIAAPIERLPRVGRELLRLLILAAAGFAAATIVGLVISETSTLFGFHEQGYRASIDLSLAFEGAVIFLCGLFLVLEVRTTGHPARLAGSQPDLHAQSSGRRLPVQGHGA
jgi:hypothetical protein